MEILTDTSREGLEFVYDRIATYIPFEECPNEGVDRYGEKYKDKEYLICLSSGGTEMKVYAPIPNHNMYKEVGYIQYVEEKVGRQKNMKVWFLTVEPDYNGLGLASMLMAGVKHVCMENNISTITLDAARRYKEKTDESVKRHPETKDDGHFMYNANLAIYRQLGFEIDTDNPSYEKGMEDDFTNNSPIPMICKLEGIVSPASYQRSYQQTFNSSVKETGVDFELTF